MADFGISEIALIATLASAAVSAVGSISAGNAQADAQRFNAEVAQQQATAQANQIEQQNRRKQGQVAAAFGAAGVDLEGTPLEVMSDTAAQGELSRQLALYRGNLTSQSDIAQGTAAQQAGEIRAGSTLLTSAGNLVKGSGGGAGTSPLAANTAGNFT